MIVNICGIPHKIVYVEDSFDAEAHFGQIDYKTGIIKISTGMTPEIEEETIIHEVLHGMLVHLGYNEQSDDEQFVNALSNAIYQSFDIRLEEDENETV